jgi:hypothetical protein
VKVYVVKHFWDEETKGTRVKPEWIIDSKENLTNEEKTIRNLVLEKLIKPAYYFKYTSEKPSMLNIDGYYVYFCYKTKLDPDPSNNRIVTDVTFFISKKKINIDNVDLCNAEIPKNYILELRKKTRKRLALFITFFLLSMFAGFYFLSENDKLETSRRLPIKTSIIEKKLEVIAKNKILMETKNISKVENSKIKKVSQKNDVVNTFCQNEYIKKLIDSEKCYSDFINNKCNGKIPRNTSFRSWLDGINRGKYKTNNPICKLIAKKGKDEDLNSLYRKINKKEYKRLFLKSFREL